MAIGRMLGEGNWGQVYSAAEGDSVIKVDKRSGGHFCNSVS